MIHENLTPKEALERAKLLMKYDTRKTLSENVQEIKKPVNEIAVLGFAIPWMYAGGAAAVGAVGTWLYNVSGSGSAPNKVKAFFDGCSTVMSKLKPTSGVDHRGAANQIFDAVDGLGTDEDAIRDALSSMKTPADLCELYRVYNLKYDDLYDDIDGDIDGDSWKIYVWAPMADIIDANPLPEEGKKEEGQTQTERQKNINSIWCATDKDGVIRASNSVVNGMKWSEYIKKYNVTASEIDVAKASCPNKSEGGDGDKDRDGDKERKKKTSTNWKTDCAPNYVKGCKSDKIAEIQRCLGLTADGKFGPKTQNKLAQKGFSNGFTDSDISKICGTSTTQNPPVNPDVEYDDETNQNF